MVLLLCNQLSRRAYEIVSNQLNWTRKHQILRGFWAQSVQARHLPLSGCVENYQGGKQMGLNNSNKKIGGYLLAVFAMFGILSVASMTANAQYQGYGRDRDYRDDRYRRDDRYNRNGYNNGSQVARQQGYSYGMNVGAADAQRGQSFSPQRSHYWKDGSAGYSSYYGNRGQYKQIFRDAFAQGYREGFQRFGGYNRRGNNGGWGNGRNPW